MNKSIERLIDFYHWFTRDVPRNEWVINEWRQGRLPNDRIIDLLVNDMESVAGTDRGRS